MSLAPEILDLTRACFPDFGAAPIEVVPLEKGGSDRKFYRLKTGATPSLIYVQYGSQKEENRHYVEIGAFLEKAGVRVPKMYRHELEHGRIWMEDLGERDLWSFREEPWEVRRPLYEATLREVLQLHSAAKGGLPAGHESLILQPPFDANLYRWEQDYFFQNCLGRHFGRSPESTALIKAKLEGLAEELAGLPRVLVHRDFQSQNVVIRGTEPCLIDFQGMRFGLPQYDLASILLDPYVSLTSREREELLGFYCRSLRALGDDPGQDFRRVYALCAAQRLMQALGAYGFLGYEKGRTEFLKHIPVAIERLESVLHGAPELSELGALLGELRAESQMGRN